MPSFVRLYIHGRAQFSIDWRPVQNNKLHQQLGTIADEDIIPITETEAREGIDALRNRYFPEPLPAEQEYYHGA